MVLTTVDYFTHREGTFSYVTDNSHLQIKHTVGQTGPIRKRRYQAIYNCFLLPPTVLVERIWGSFEWTDLEFSLVDVEFYALFDGIIFKIEI